MAADHTTASDKTQKQTNGVQSTLTWLPKKTFELEITIPKETVKSTYDKVLTQAAKETELKGFRKGKAPKDLVEKTIGKDKLYGEVIQNVVSDAYVEAVKKHNLRPVVNPTVNPISLKEGEDWVVKATSCEPPEVKLGKYKEAIKGLKAKKSLWTPDKANKPEDDKKDADNQPSLDEIFSEVLKNTEIEIPDMLLDSETSRMLSQLVDQVNAVGITIQQYFESRNTTQEQVQAEYRNRAENSLKLEFILAQIALDEKIEVKPSEIEEMINKTPDVQTKQAMQQPEQRNYLALLLRKQKTIDYLKSL